MSSRADIIKQQIEIGRVLLEMKTLFFEHPGIRESDSSMNDQKITCLESKLHTCNFEIGKILLAEKQARSNHSFLSFLHYSGLSVTEAKQYIASVFKAR